jgi:hypothetical protein
MVMHGGNNRNATMRAVAVAMAPPHHATIGHRLLDLKKRISDMTSCNRWGQIQFPKTWFGHETVCPEIDSDPNLVNAGELGRADHPPIGAPASASAPPSIS